MSDPIIKSIYDFSPEALGQLKLWIEQAGVAIPVNQLVGFTAFQAQQTKVDTQQSTGSTTYTDLATVGPQITGLRPGKYLFLFGCAITSGGVNDVGYVGISLDGAAVQSTDAFQGDASSILVLGSVATTGTLTNNDGATVTVKYHTQLGNSTKFSQRWLVVLKYA